MPKAPHKEIKLTKEQAQQKIKEASLKVKARIDAVRERQKKIKEKLQPRKQP